MYLPWKSENMDTELLLTNHNNNQEKQADFKMSNYRAFKFLDLFPHAYVAFS